VKKKFVFEKELVHLKKRISPDCSGIPHFLVWIERKAGLSSKKKKMIEIERKFLVQSGEFKAISFAKNEIAQGYLNSNPERTVRVRIKGNQGYLTIKGKGNETGLSRFEWENKIPIDEAKMLLNLCESGVISKMRYEVKFGNHVYEVDKFFGENEGLIIAEIELQSEDEAFEKPDWLGTEVTNDEKYYNSYLSKNPYKNW